MARLNPAQHRLLQRHIDRAVEALREADRLLGGAARDLLAPAIDAVESVLRKVDHEEVPMVSFPLVDLPQELVPYLDNPFAQGLKFNLFCIAQDLSHTKATKVWQGGNSAVSARNLVFLPPVYGELWDSGLLDKTRLAAIANRNLTDAAYKELADMVRTRRKEDLDDRLLKMPASAMKVGRRGPEQAMEAAQANGWMERFQRIDVAADLVKEAGRGEEQRVVEETPADHALRTLRAGLSGARVQQDVIDNLGRSPDPMALVERFLAAHRKAGDADPEELTKTLFYAHAGPMQKLIADDKLLLRHFRPVKTQKRGQLFYRLLEVIEQRLLERQHAPDLEARGITEAEAMEAVRTVVAELNSDPNRYLVIPDEWLGEVTRRHLYFGSRTRKDGAAYKWFRKIGPMYFLGAHKTAEEMAEREARRSAKATTD